MNTQSEGKVASECYWFLTRDAKDKHTAFDLWKKAFSQKKTGGCQISLLFGLVTPQELLKSNDRYFLFITSALYHPAPRLQEVEEKKEENKPEKDAAPQPIVPFIFMHTNFENCLCHVK